MNTIHVPEKLKIVSSFVELIDYLKDVLLTLEKEKDSIIWVTGEYNSKKYLDQIIEQLKIKNPDIYIVQKNNLTAATDLTNKIIERNKKCIISVGSGRVIDIAKYCANKTNIYMIAIPTTLSNDGISSPVSVLLDQYNKNISLPSKIPNVIFIDLSYVSKSPVKLLRAGIGDLMSNITAVYDWQLAEKDIQEELNDFALLTSITAVNSILTLYETDINSEAFIEGLARGLILSGISMEMSGNSRPASGSEHKISHTIDYLFPGRALHGEQVAVGTIIASYLQNGDWRKIKAFFTRYGVPVRAEEINLTEKEMVQVLVNATHSRVRYTILEKIKLSEKESKNVLKETGII